MTIRWEQYIEDGAEPGDLRVYGPTTWGDEDWQIVSRRDAVALMRCAERGIAWGESGPVELDYDPAVNLVFGGPGHEPHLSVLGGPPAPLDLDALRRALEGR
jgi:hypothetical protein